MADHPTGFTELSDDEFRAELRRHLPTRSWSLRHIIELERRGFDCLAADAELDHAINEDYERLQQRFRAAVQPIVDRWRATIDRSGVGRQLAEQVGASTTAKFFKDIDTTALKGPTPPVSWMATIPPTSVPISAPGFEDVLEQVIEQEDERVREAEWAVELQVEQLEVLRGIQLQTRRDGWGWLEVCAAVVAAVAAVIAAVATVDLPT